MALPPDILGTGKAVEEAVSLVREPVQTLLGPAWNELGAALGDKVRHWRDMRRLERAISAVRLIEAKGLNPKQVDPSLLFPLLDGASVASDANMKGRWDALLANAADPTANVEVLPSFPKILEALVPLEAQLLEAAYAADTNTRTKIAVVVRGAPEALSFYASDKEAETVITVKFTDYQVFGHDLTRLGLCYLVGVDRPKVRSPEPPRCFILRVTPLGRAFVNACKY